MRIGTYRDQAGRLATVHITPSGYLIHYTDGRVVSIAATSRAHSVVQPRRTVTPAAHPSSPSWALPQTRCG